MDGLLLLGERWAESEKIAILTAPDPKTWTSAPANRCLGFWPHASIRASDDAAAEEGTCVPAA